jgi:hypothetical protein
VESGGSRFGKFGQQLFFTMKSDYLWHPFWL